MFSGYYNSFLHLVVYTYVYIYILWIVIISQDYNPYTISELSNILQLHFNLSIIFSVQCRNNRILRLTSGLWCAIKSSTSACTTTSIDEPLLAGKDMRRKCDGVGDNLERNLEGLSEVELVSLTEGCLSSFSLLAPNWCPGTGSLEVKLFRGLSTMVMARHKRLALRWLCSFFFNWAWAILKSFSEHRRESKLIALLTFSSRDCKRTFRRLLVSVIINTMINLEVMEKSVDQPLDLQEWNAANGTRIQIGSPE